MMKKLWKEYSLIAAGAFLVALGMNLFLVPGKLSPGGVSTLGTVLLYVFGIPLFITSLVCNGFLFFFGFRCLGKQGAVKTGAGILFLSLFLAMSASLPPVCMEILPLSVCGGILVGIGVGVVLRAGGATGGSDFAALMIHRLFPHFSVAGIVLALDFVMITFSGLVFQSFEVAFFSLVSLFVSTKMTDWILNIGTLAKAVLIFPEEPEVLQEMIFREFCRGVTQFQTRGGFTGKEKKTLFCVTSPKEAPLLIRRVKELDEKAFLVVLDSREVLGKGFSFV